MIALLSTALLVMSAYFLGSIPTGALLARARGVDIRAVGSGNIGATNVARSLGKKLGLVVLVLDAAKGAIPALAAAALARAELIDPYAIVAASFAAILGHCFPVWLGFRGGKGVATALGVMLALAPLVTLIAAAVFGAVYAVFRVASLGSITAALSVTPLLLVLGYPHELVALAAVTAALIVFKHRGNLVRVLGGKELRV